MGGEEGRGGGGWKKRYWQEELVGKLALRGNDIFTFCCSVEEEIPNEMIEACRERVK